MKGVPQMFGHQGPIDGDPFVAELLRRTYNGTLEAMNRFNKSKKEYLPGQTSVYEIPFPQMTVILGHWMSLIYWEMATAFTDGIITMYQDEVGLSQGIYEYSDGLCDIASSLNREAIKRASEFANQGKLTMTQLLDGDDTAIDESIVEAQWAASLAIVGRVLKDARFISQRPIPERMVGIHEALMRQINQCVSVIDSLKHDWKITTMLDNQCGLAGELQEQALGLLRIGQMLWAPYLRDEYIQELKRKPTLQELECSFDPWILTDPHQKKAREKQPGSVEKLVEFWESQADREATLALGRSVQAALKDGTLRRRTGITYNDVPWASQYLVRRPIKFGVRDFECGHLCTFFVSEDDAGKTVVEMRRSGRLMRTLDQLGQGKN